MKKEITSGSPKPVYFLCGEETFFIDALQNEFLKLIAPDMRDFNYDLMYGNEHTLQQVIGIARSYPMMSERRLVIIREFSAMFDKRLQTVSDDEKKKNEQEGESYSATFEPLIQFLEKPNPTAVLVIIDKKAPSGNTKLGKALKGSEHVSFAQFDPIPDFKLPEWILDWTNKVYNKQIDPKAALLLAQNTGSDLVLVSKELDKLCTFKNTSEAINEEDVKKLVGFSREISAFELKDALFSKNIPKAFQIAEQLLHNTKTTDVGEVMRIVSFFYSVFSNIWQIQRLTAKGLPSNQIQKEVGVNSEFYFRNLVKDSKVFPAEHIPLIFECLLDADKALKGMTRMEPKDILFLTLRRIIG